MNDITKEQLLLKIKFHIEFGIPYELEMTGTRKIFKSRRGQYVCREKKFDAKELNFIKSVKHNIIKNEVYSEIPNKFKTDKDKEKIKYATYNKKYKSGDFIENVKEIDLKSAYWETSNMKGILTPETYIKGQSVSKQSRLASIGSLAKKVRKISFDGTKEINNGTIRSDKTEFLWDMISHEVGKVMLKGVKQAKNDCIFFWVDAIFVKGDASVDRIVKVFNELGYKSSVYHCEWVKFEENKIIVHSKEKAKYKVIDGKKVLVEERPFPFNDVMSERQKRLMGIPSEFKKSNEIVSERQKKKWESDAIK